jgi:hypothetical protein
MKLVVVILFLTVSFKGISQKAILHYDTLVIKRKAKLMFFSNDTITMLKGIKLRNEVYQFAASKSLYKKYESNYRLSAIYFSSLVLLNILASNSSIGTPIVVGVGVPIFIMGVNKIFVSKKYFKKAIAAYNFEKRLLL